MTPEGLLDDMTIWHNDKGLYLDCGMILTKKDCSIATQPKLWTNRGPPENYLSHIA